MIERQSNLRVRGPLVRAFVPHVYICDLGGSRGEHLLQAQGETKKEAKLKCLREYREILAKQMQEIAEMIEEEV